MADHLKPISLTVSQIESLKEKATFGNTYRFFDVTAVIRSDSPDLLEFFRQAYRHFLARAPRAKGKTLSYYVLTETVSPWGPLVIRDETNARLLPEGEALANAADVIIFGTVLSKITSHFLVHGAVVASPEGAIVLSGLSGCGKTTLALELTRRGLQFCSDEIAAISRATHRIFPFPRGIGTRENTVRLLNKIDFTAGTLHHTTGGERKWIVDIEDVFDAPLGGICQGKHVILLETVLDGSGWPQKGYHNIDIALKRIDHDLIHQLSSIEGVEYRSLSTGKNVPFVGFRVQKRNDTQRDFLKACEHYKDSILYKVKVVEKNPDPRQSPRLFPLTRVEAALELLGNLQNLVNADGSMSPPSSANTVKYLYELLDAISGMECHRLLVGNLKKTADLILDMAN